jgi:hypothetical protein
LLLLVLVSGRCDAELRVWAVDEVEEFARGITQAVQVHPDSLVILDWLSRDENLALGRKTVDEFGKGVPLSDGSVALVRSEWISGVPNVFDRNFTVDLGLDRAINRVRVLAGETALNQPEYFMRGYRFEAATQNAPQVWQVLAEEPANFVLNVDTRRDSTWAAVDEQGAAIPRLGRFVRLTLIRQDRSNWVAIGEIEVYGVGYASEGYIEDGFVPSTPVNVGRIRWQVERPPRTQIELQLRGISSGQETPVWEELDVYTEGEFSFAGPEPVERLDYRVRLQNSAPFSTPALKRIEVEYDPVLVVHRLLGAVEALDTVRKGALTRLSYRVEVEMEPGDYGVDILRLDGAALAVDILRLNGRDLVHDPTLTRGFRWSGTPDQEGTFVELAPEERIVSSGTVEIEGRALFVRDKTSVELAAGSREQSERDGYVNWQQGREAPGATWTVFASGAPLRLLGRVEVSPRPFSPFADEKVGFDFVVGNIEEGKEIALEIFSLDGRRVRRLAQTGRGRAYHFEWDGRDQQDRIAAPGLYLYEARVEDSGASRRGTFVVAY